MTCLYLLFFMRLILPLINQIEILISCPVGPTSQRCSLIPTKANMPHWLSFPIFFSWSEDAVKTEHKYLGMILDCKPNFRSHIREATIKARRGIGIIQYLFKNVSQGVLDQIYKLYV